MSDLKPAKEKIGFYNGLQPEQDDQNFTIYAKPGLEKPAVVISKETGQVNFPQNMDEVISHKWEFSEEKATDFRFTTGNKIAEYEESFLVGSVKKIDGFYLLDVIGQIKELASRDHVNGEITQDAFKRFTLKTKECINASIVMTGIESIVDPNKRIDPWFDTSKILFRVDGIKSNRIDFHLKMIFKDK